jgi:large subunit ribosomal protein L15
MEERLLKIHHLRPAPGSKKAKTRVGRGDASKGKTAGRGTKGTKARNTVAVNFEGGQMPIQMRLPKLRGFKNFNRVEYQVVNIGDIEERFEGGTVGILELKMSGLITNKRPVKILGEGDVTKKFEVVADKISKSAREKLESAGGSFTQNN